MKRQTLYLILIFCVFIKVDAQDKPNKDVDGLREKITTLEKTVSEQKIALDAVDKLYDKRFADFYIWLVIFVALISVALAGTYYNAKNSAEKEARDEIKAYKTEFDNMKEDYSKEFKTMQNQYAKIVADISNLQESIKSNLNDNE